MGLKKRRITANDRNYSGGSFNLKRGAVSPLANTMAAIGEGGPPPDAPAAAVPPLALSGAEPNPSDAGTSPPSEEQEGGGILRRISAGVVRFFSDKSRSASAATLTTPATATPINQVAPQPLCPVVEPSNADEDGSSRASSLVAPVRSPEGSGSMKSAIRRLSVSVAHMFTDSKPSTNESPDAVEDTGKGRGRSMSVSETLVSMVHRGPVDRFGQGNVTNTGLDASFVDEGLHVLIDGAPDSSVFAQTLLDKLTDVFASYTKTDDFLLCVNPPQIAGELKIRLNKAVAAAQKAVAVEVMASASASVGIAIIHRHPKDTIARLHVLNIGNTKTFVVRRQEIVFESSSLMLGFKRPLRVLSTPAAPTAEPTVLYEMCQLEAGDVVVSCTDGVTDNLYANEIIETIQVVSKYRNSSWDWVAQEIAQVAMSRVDQPLNRQSPFAKEAAAELYRNIDHNTDLLSQYAPLLRQDINLSKTALFRNTNTRQGEDHSLDQLAQWARAIVGTTDDATVVISTV